LRTGGRNNSDEEDGYGEQGPEEDSRAALLEVAQRPGNGRCADCTGPEPTEWAVVNWGVFVCVHCCAIHRQLGTHVSRVRSTTLDTWTLDEVEFMRVMGNVRANSIWEQDVPPGWDKPGAGAEDAHRLSWIDAKYVQQHFFGITGSSPHASAAAPSSASPEPFRLAEAHVHTLAHNSAQQQQQHQQQSRRGSASLNLEESAAQVISRFTSSLGFGNGAAADSDRLPPPLRALTMTGKLRRGPSTAVAAAAAAGSVGMGPQQPIAVLLILGQISDYPLHAEREFTARLRRRVAKLLAPARSRLAATGAGGNGGSGVAGGGSSSSGLGWREPIIVRVVYWAPMLGSQEQVQRHGAWPSEPSPAQLASGRCGSAARARGARERRPTGLISGSRFIRI
jgi:hypothetical protein